MFQSSKPQAGVSFESLLDGTYYSEPRIFDKEIKKIFSTSWIFGGSISQFPRNGDRLEIDLLGWSIAIEKSEDRIQAFQNLASTTDAKIEFRTETIGDLIFVKMPEASASLAEFMGEMYSVLKDFDRNWTTRNPQERVDFKCNWKLIAETTLEAYHTAQVHPGTLGTNVSPIEYYNFSRSSLGHQIINIGNHPNPNRMTSAFTILFFFPALFIVKLDDKHCWLHQILPQTVAQTRMRYLSFYMRSAPLSDADLRMTGNAVRLTAAEDREACEAVQKNIAKHKVGQPLANLEEGIFRFQEQCLKRLKTFF